MYEKYKVKEYRDDIQDIKIVYNEDKKQYIAVDITEDFVCKFFSSPEQMRKKMRMSATRSCTTPDKFDGQLAVIREGLLSVSIFATFKNGERIYQLCGIPDNTGVYYQLIKKICLSLYDEETPYSAV